MLQVATEAHDIFEDICLGTVLIESWASSRLMMGMLITSFILADKRLPGGRVYSWPVGSTATSR